LIKYKPDLAEKSAKSGLVLHYPAKLTENTAITILGGLLWIDFFDHS
jgi:hypothetical protein